MPDDQLLKLAARLYVQQIILVELCRRHLGLEDVERLLKPLAPAVLAKWSVGEDAEITKAIDEALAELRQEIMLPDMG